MEKARYNTELYSNLRAPLNNVKPSNFWGSHQFRGSAFSHCIDCQTDTLCRIAKRTAGLPSEVEDDVAWDACCVNLGDVCCECVGD